MKLLSPDSRKNAKDQQDLKGIIRTQEIQKAEEKARKDLANSQADFQLILARNRREWALEEEEHLSVVKARNQEIDLLETKRLNALEPIEKLKQRAEEQLREAETYIVSIREQEGQNEVFAELLQDKLDIVGAREQDLNRKKIELDIREDSLNRQIQSNSQNTTLLNQQIAEFIEFKKNEEKDLLERVNNASLLEQSLGIQEEAVSKARKTNEEESIKLADERGTLQRAWNELERKKIQYSNRK